MSCWFAVIALAGCGSSVQQANGGGGSGGAGTTTSTSAGGTGGECGWQECSCGTIYCSTCAGCDKSCDPTDPCPEQFYCDYPDDLCGKGSKGVCQPVPADCADGPPEARACGCSGIVTGTNCVYLSGSDISADPLLCSDGTFACGDLACKKYVEYCETTTGGASDQSSYACKATTCPMGIAECECIAGLPAGSCQRDANGQIQVTIAAP